MTPHISARPGDFARDVLMPGDPRRARHIAHEILDDARLVTSVRGIEGYTGTWNDRPVSVMASGMGIPSISIYATELFRFYDVQRIIRIGTCGALPEEIALGDVIIGSTCTTNSSVGSAYHSQPIPNPAPSTMLVNAAIQAADHAIGGSVREGHIFTSDLFYDPRPGTADALKATGVVAIEMEAAGLYYAARHHGREALAILTTTDLIVTGAKLTVKNGSNCRLSRSLTRRSSASERSFSGIQNYHMQWWDHVGAELIQRGLDLGRKLL